MQIRPHTTLNFNKRYVGKNIWILLSPKNTKDVFLYPNDYLLRKFAERGIIKETKSYQKKDYNISRVSKTVRDMLNEFKIN